jgi:polar amino acid transport system substrate-binding protein
MAIRQAVGTTKSRQPETIQFLRDLIDELTESGFVAKSLEKR